MTHLFSKIRRSLLRASLLGTLTLITLPGMARADFTDPFDTISPDWVLNRYDPHGFESVSFLGDNRLKLTIDQAESAANRPDGADDGFPFNGPFYNTQGRMRFSNVLGKWSLTAEAYISSAFNTTTGQIIRSDLWGQTGTNPDGGDFAVFGFTNASPTDMFNPAALDRSFRFRAFDENIGWIDLTLPGDFTYDAWHTLSITSNNSIFTYSLDGAEVYHNVSIEGNGLLRGMVQGYNFGEAGNYSVYWDNVSAIPEPADFALGAGLMALGMLAYRRRQRRAVL